MLFSKSFVVAFAMALGAQAMTVPRAEAFEQDEAWWITCAVTQSQKTLLTTLIRIYPAVRKL